MVISDDALSDMHDGRLQGLDRPDEERPTQLAYADARRRWLRDAPDPDVLSQPGASK